MVDFKHILDAAASAFAETLWSTRCVSCDLPGALLCEHCARRLPRIDAALACPHCGAPYGWLACASCTPAGEGPARHLHADDFAFAAARAACVYDGVAKSVITAYKDADELRCDAIIAGELAASIRGGGVAAGPGGADAAPGDPRRPAGFGDAHAARQDWAAWADALVAVPAAPASLRRRGYDHMARIARLVSEGCGLPLLCALRSRKAADQRGLSATQRAANRAASFTLAPDAAQLPPHVLLVDDVLTTGATLSAAAGVLLANGAKEVRAATYARTW